MNDYRTDAPPILRDFLAYHETIKAHSKRTVDEYYLDLRNFFRYMKQIRNPALSGKSLDEISILDVDLNFVASITLTDIYGYMTYLSRDRVRFQNSRNSNYGLNAASRARKIATIRSFYGYLTNKTHQLRENPVKDLDSPKLKKTLPKYLTLDESLDLLNAVDGKNQERDYAILTLFLNCGLRISELVGLNLQDIQGETLRVLGKGNKVRILYLNDACQDAIKRYLSVRRPITGRDANALFLSAQIERVSRSWRAWLWPGWGNPEPSCLRTRPATQERIARLLTLAPGPASALPLRAPHFLPESALATRPPRWRPSGLWR